MKVIDEDTHKVMDDVDFGKHYIPNQPREYENVGFGQIQNIIDYQMAKIICICTEDWEKSKYRNIDYITEDDIKDFMKLDKNNHLVYDWDELDPIENYTDLVAGQRVLFIGSDLNYPVVYLLVNENDGSLILKSRAELEALSEDDE